MKQSGVRTLTPSLVGVEPLHPRKRVTHSSTDFVGRSDLATIVTASVAAVAGGVVTAVGSILRTRSTGRTAARLVYAELTRNSAAVGYYCVTGRWPSAQFSHDAWDKQGEALARMHGADTFDCVYRGYSALEGVAYIAGDVTIAADQRTVLLEENLSELRRAITQVGGQATIPSQRVSIETGRLTLPPAASTLSGQRLHHLLYSLNLLTYSGPAAGSFRPRSKQRLRR